MFFQGPARHPQLPIFPKVLLRGWTLEQWEWECCREAAVRGAGRVQATLFAMGLCGPTGAFQSSSLLVASLTDHTRLKSAFCRVCLHPQACKAMVATGLCTLWRNVRVCRFAVLHPHLSIWGAFHGVSGHPAGQGLSVSSFNSFAGVPSRCGWHLPILL